MQPSFVIDYGTSKSVITWIKPGSGEPQVIRNLDGDESTPSAVYFGESETLVGNAALNMLDGDEAASVILSAKRSLGLEIVYPCPGKPRPIDAAAAVIRYLLETAHKDAEVQVDGPIQSAVITCPATFTGIERENLIAAGKLAGLSKVILRDEPVAAAIACAKALPHAIGKTVLVYDLGAGTFDVAVLTLNKNGQWKQATSPSGIRLGGDSFDLALYRFLDEQAHSAVGEGLGEPASVLIRKCRQAKESAVTFGKTNFSHQLPSGKFFRRAVTREEFCGLIREMVVETVQYVEKAVNQAAENGRPIDSLVLIGGSSRVPVVNELVTGLVKREPLEWNRREYAVALGGHGEEGNPTEKGDRAPLKPLSEYKLGEQIGQPWIGHQKRVGFNNGVRAVAFSPDGTKLVSGGYDQTIRLWDVETGLQIGEPWMGHKGSVTSLRFSPDGSLVVSGGDDATVRIWDIENGKEIQSPFDDRKGAIIAVACRPDGAHVVSAGVDNAVVWSDPESSKQWMKKSMAGANHLAVSFSPGLEYIAYGGEDRIVYLMNAWTSSNFKVLDHLGGAIRAIEFNPVKRNFISGGNDNRARLHSLPDVNIHESKQVRFWTHPAPVLSLAFSPDGRRFVSGCSDGNLRMWDTENADPIGEPWSGHDRMIWCVAFSPNGKIVVSGGSDCTLRAWKATDETPQAEAADVEKGISNGSVAPTAAPKSNRRSTAESDSSLPIARFRPRR